VTPRIAIVNSSSQIGGAELSLLPVVRALGERADVGVFLPGDGPLHEELQALGAKTDAFSLGTHLVRASRQYGTSTGTRLVTEAIRQQAKLLGKLWRMRPDALYCNGFRAQFAATAPGQLLRIPTVWHVRDFVPEDQFSRVWAMLARRARLVIANSAATARQPSLRDARVLVVWNGIDLERFRPRDEEPLGPAILGMAAHLTPWKGHLRFARVLAQVRERVPSVRGTIAGGDLYDTATHRNYAAELRDGVMRLGVDDILDVRHVSPAQMPSWLASLSVLVHCPDRPEPFGRSLAEALAVGVPVVAAAGPGAEEVVGDAGVTLPIGAEEETAHAVHALLQDPARRATLAAAGVNRARSLLDERVYTERVAAAVLNVVTKRA
jgi:glycosyltransferase involved in cell wall biosynthesis